MQNCEYKKDYQFLSSEQFSQAKKALPNQDLSKTVRKLNIKCGEQLEHAYILNNKIRTHYQTVLVWVNQSGLKDFKYLRFDEPVQYKPPGKWLDHLKQKSKNLLEVDALSGATLSRKSALDLVKRAMYFERI